MNSLPTLPPYPQQVQADRQMDRRAGYDANSYIYDFEEPQISTPNCLFRLIDGPRFLERGRARMPEYLTPAAWLPTSMIHISEYYRLKREYIFRSRSRISIGHIGAHMQHTRHRAR
jgi:hypothetical protein